MIQSLISKQFAGNTILLFLIVLPSISYATGCTVTLKWNTNNPPPDGYRLFIHEQGQEYNYAHHHYEGGQTTATIDGFEEGKTYYSVVRAFKGELESSNSNEVHYTFNRDCKIISSNFPWILLLPTMREKARRASLR